MSDFGWMIKRTCPGCGTKLAHGESECCYQCEKCGHQGPGVELVTVDGLEQELCSECQPEEETS